MVHVHCFQPTFRTSQVSHYEFWEFGEIGLTLASPISHFCVEKVTNLVPKKFHKNRL